MDEAVDREGMPVTSRGLGRAASFPVSSWSSGGAATSGGVDRRSGGGLDPRSRDDEKTEEEGWERAPQPPPMHTEGGHAPVSSV